MLVLTENNDALDTDTVGDGSDFHYGVLDFVKQKSPDYFFQKWEKPWWKFVSSSAVLEVGPFTVVLPFKWSILVVHNGVAECVLIEELAGKDHEAFGFNPISGYMPNYLPIRFMHGHKNQEWVCPMLKNSQLLVIPVGYQRGTEGVRKRGPICIMAWEKSGKIPDGIDASVLW